MKVNEKIRVLREERLLSQEEMAEKMAVSTNTYGKIERGETRLTIKKLEDIAQIFDISVIDLIQDDEKNIAYQVNNHSSGINAVNIQGNIDEVSKILLQNEKLQLIINHKDETILHQKQEIQLLREMLALLQNPNKN